MKRLALVATILLTALISIASHSQATDSLPLDKALKKAQVSGKYRMLLRQIRLPDDRLDFPSFADFGYRTETTCGDYKGLPKGYWVYVYPYWYIWRDRVAGNETSRAWGPEQATGKPNTPDAGDYQSAWASATQDGCDEWLMLEYETPVWAKAAHIYETYNPGAVVRITAFTLDDREIEIWKRARPDIFPQAQPRYLAPYGATDLFLGGESERQYAYNSRVGQQSTQPFGRIFKPAFSTRVFTNRIKIYMASKAVPGWNEIDAVGLRGEDGSLQWATAAHASSIYGIGDSDESRVDPRDERILRLEDENRRLRDELARVKR